VNNDPVNWVDLWGLKANESKYSWPMETGRLTSVKGEYDYLTPQGEYRRKEHGGIDIGAAEGTPVKSIAAGTVLSTSANINAYGNFIVIDHGNGVTSKYSHLKNAPSLTEGDSVKQGTILGAVGNTSGGTNSSTGPHLDLEIFKDDKKIDPLSILGPLPLGITPAIGPGYLKSDGNGGYTNWLLVPGSTTKPNDVYHRSQ
jgi:murein DD-endopeptidase MepM/ murein hydrolase activator NlpD